MTALVVIPSLVVIPAKAGIQGTNVIPAKAGIQGIRLRRRRERVALDPRLRGDDGSPWDNGFPGDDGLRGDDGQRRCP
jgi:hypothetical protein